MAKNTSRHPKSGLSSLAGQLVRKGGVRVNADSLKSFTKSVGGESAASALQQVLVEIECEESDLKGSAKRVAGAAGRGFARRTAIEGVAKGVEKAAARTLFKEGAKSVAKEVGFEGLKQAGKAALKGNFATNTAMFAVDQAIDTYRLARGKIGRREYYARSGENVASGAGGLGGAGIGGIIGTLICPGVGTAIGVAVGGMIGGTGSSMAAGRFLRKR